MNRQPPPRDYDDNPEWNEATSARARPAREMLPAHAVAALVRRPDETLDRVERERITLEVDHAVMERFRASGPDWRSRVDDALRRAVGL